MQTARAVFFLSFSLFAASPALARDVSAEKFGRIEMGMSVDDAIILLGQPENRREEGVDDRGKPFERLEYSVVRRLKEAKEDGSMETYQSWCLVFLDGKLVRLERG